MGETNKRHENENAGKMMKNHNQENISDKNSSTMEGGGEDGGEGRRLIKQQRHSTGRFLYCYISFPIASI